MKIGIIGCGNLGSAILQGISNDLSSNQICASKRNIEELASRFKQPNITCTTDNNEVFANSDIIIICLKPFATIDFLNKYSSSIDPNRHTIISAVTGVTTEQINEVTPDGTDIYRVMPNTASSVSESITAISVFADKLNRKEEVTAIFKSIGEIVFINEELMESATVLGACGIAYVLRFMRAMIQGGIEVGFDSKTATKIVSQTIKGAAELIITNGTHPEEEIDKVTTPKGCTIVGLNEMEHAGFSSALIKGIRTSYKDIEK